MNRHANDNLPGPGDGHRSVNPRSSSLYGWDGPIYREGRDVPCHVCESDGFIEDGEQIDVDDFRDALCGHCDGTGIEPWRAAGDRDTGNPSRDSLCYPRTGHWSVTERRRRSLEGKSLAQLREIEAVVRSQEVA